MDDGRRADAAVQDAAAVVEGGEIGLHITLTGVEEYVEE